MGVFKREFNFLESICGPFPFGTDKHGWAHSPYWGMEHQTIIAYGNNFKTNSWGFDYIHYHELAHEWWGNLITAKDWAIFGYMRVWQHTRKHYMLSGLVGKKDIIILWERD